MTVNFSTLKEIGTKGPFSFKTFKFNVWVDTNDQCHLREHQGISHTQPVTQVLKAASVVFATIAPCCAQKSQWAGNNSHARHSRMLKAETLWESRQLLIEALKPLQEITPKTPKEAFGLIERALHADSWDNILSTKGSGINPWEKEFLKAHAEGIKRIKEIFFTLDHKGFLETVALQVLSPLPKPVGDPDVNKIFVNAQKLAAKKMAANHLRYLTTVLLSPATEKRGVLTFNELYRVGKRDLVQLPSPVFELLKMGIRDYAVSEENISDKVMEAVDVLYRPFETGTYSKLQATLEAAKVL